MGPQAAGARSPPEIHSQVLSRVARDPLAALCGIFPGIHSQVSGDRSPGSQIRIPLPRRPGAQGDPLGSRVFPDQLCQLFSRGLSPTETWRPSSAAASPTPSRPGDRGQMASPHPPRPPRNLPRSRHRSRPAPRRHLPAARGTCLCRPRPRAAYPAGGGASGGKRPVAMETAARGACAEGPGAER